MNTKMLFSFLFMVSVLTVAGQKPNPRTVIDSFGGECIGENYKFTRRLEKLIVDQRRKLDYQCEGSACSSSFAFDLNGDRRNEYFVRLSCGATGNCTWGVFSDAPAKLHGTFTAWFFYIHKRKGTWSPISTFTREGGDQGLITSVLYRRNKYGQVYERRERGAYGNPLPFLKRMGAPNCS